MQELIALVKAKPGKLNYGSSGIGSIHHLATRGAQGRPRPRHRARALQGHGPVGAGAARRPGADAALRRAAVDRVAREGRQGEDPRASARRSARAQAPEVPTVAELGVPGYDFVAGDRHATRPPARRSDVVGEARRRGAEGSEAAPTWRSASSSSASIRWALRRRPITPRIARLREVRRGGEGFRGEDRLSGRPAPARFSSMAASARRAGGDVLGRDAAGGDAVHLFGERHRASPSARAPVASGARTRSCGSPASAGGST